MDLDVPLWNIPLENDDKNSKIEMAFVLFRCEIKVIQKLNDSGSSVKVYRFGVKKIF